MPKNDVINKLCWIIIEAASNRYVSSNDLDFANGCLDKVQRQSNGLQADTCQDHTWNETHTGFKFCPDCGQPLSSPPPVRAERMNDE